MEIYELLLQGSVCPLNETIFPGASWINEVVFDISFLEIFVKLFEKLRAIISLNNTDSSFIRVDAFKFLKKGNRVSAI